MTDRYQKIRDALEMEPTQGPWRVIDGDSYPFVTVALPENEGRRWNDPVVCALYEDVTAVDWVGGGRELEYLPNAHANAVFIAACDPDTIRALLDERDALLAKAREEVEKLHTLPSAEDLEERAHEILDGAGIPTHALDPVSGEEDYRADLEERLEWTVAEITRLRKALEPFAHFGAAVLLVDNGSGKWHSIRVDGQEYTISFEDFRRARTVLTGEEEA